MNYQTGAVNNIKGDDPVFDTESECIDWIMQRSDRAFTIYGIWTGQNFGSELICFVMEGEVFRK